jgi:hypothetical protein
MTKLNVFFPVRPGGRATTNEEVYNSIFTLVHYASENNLSLNNSIDYPGTPYSVAAVDNSSVGFYIVGCKGPSAEILRKGADGKWEQAPRWQEVVRGILMLPEDDGKRPLTAQEVFDKVNLFVRNTLEGEWPAPQKIEFIGTPYYISCKHNAIFFSGDKYYVRILRRDKVEGVWFSEARWQSAVREELGLIEKDGNIILEPVKSVKPGPHPDFCLSLLQSTWDGSTAEVIGIKRDDGTGYYETTYGRQSREWLAMMNERLGVDEALQQAFETCSIFGNWSNFGNVHEHIRQAIERQAGKKNEQDKE